MADIAAVFHWPLSEMVGMDVGELAAWRERAAERMKALTGEQKDR